MDTTQKLVLRQRQALTLTPEMLQSLRLLQASQEELAAFIEAECERNPLLAYEDSASDTAPLPPRVRTTREADRMIRRVFSPGPFGTAGAMTASSRDGASSRGMPVDPASAIAAGLSLGDHLESQLAIATADPALLMAGRSIVRNLTETGYLAGDIDEIAETTGLPADTIRTALALVQSFEPAGIAARDLAECLTIQLREEGLLDAAMSILLGRLDLLAKGDIASLCRLCRTDEAALRAMIGTIRRLDPRPGLHFVPARIERLVPDVLVSRAPDGSLQVSLNGCAAPRVGIDRDYLADVAPSAKSASDKAYVSECVKSAASLSRILDQRASSVFTVATEIVRQQEAFFQNGCGHLRPLNLRAVAAATGLHLSTISRVTANKAIGSESGVFPMKFFFTAALGGADGHAAAAVRHRIGDIIAGESPDNVLSDEAIARQLSAAGVAIARRTVAKYRESLRIPSSARRRRLARSRTFPP